jgi:hypothetical protein
MFNDALTKTAISATLHCLTGCAIGEVLGMVISTAANLSNLTTIIISTALAFIFGYTLTTLPLLKSGLSFKAALGIAFASDTLFIGTMEVVDNTIIAAIPGALYATLSQPLFWASLLLSLVIAFIAAVPVNRFLLARGKGHALVHEYHQHPQHHTHQEDTYQENNNHDNHQ